MKYLTIHDVADKLHGVKVFVRADTNATLKNCRMSLTERAVAAFETVRFLAQKGACVILGTHNGRQGEPDYVSIGPLFQQLKERGEDIPDMALPGNTYNKEQTGLNAETIEKIRKMRPGEILLLENLRFLQNETDKCSAQAFREKQWVRDMIDACQVEYAVLDGFSVAHRPQMSLIGLAEIPNLAGLTLQRELEGGSRVLNLLQANREGRGGVVFILGGGENTRLYLLDRSRVAKQNGG